jgi:hypothetical protein
MDYNEMLLAAAVRDLAQKLKADTWKAHRNNVDPEVELDDAASQAMYRDWMDKNPTSNFVPEALKRVRDVADQIRNLPA